MSTFLYYLNIDADWFIEENIRMEKLIGEQAFRTLLVLCETEEEIITLLSKAR